MSEKDAMIMNTGPSGIRYAMKTIQIGDYLHRLPRLQVKLWDADKQEWYWQDVPTVDEERESGIEP